jgi:DNA-binding GntR family transcriptional regulator
MHAASERGDAAGYYQGNLEFHWNIVSAAGNDELIGIYRGIVQRLHVARLKSLSTDTAMMSSLRDHDEIVQAIRRGDAAGCADLMSQHVLRAAERLGQPAVAAVADARAPSKPRSRRRRTQ